MTKLSERARDFWDRISPRERRLVVIAAVAAPLTIALWLGFAIHDGLDAMETRNDQTRRALKIIADLRARGPASAAEPKEQMTAEVLSLDTYLDQAAQTAGFTLKGTTPHSPVTRNGFVTNTVTVNVDDLELEKLKTFLQAVETQSKFVAITKLDIRRDRDKTKVDAKLEVSTYSREPDAKPEGGDDQRGG